MATGAKCKNSNARKTSYNAVGRTFEQLPRDNEPVGGLAKHQLWSIQTRLSFFQHYSDGFVLLQNMLPMLITEKKDSKLLII